MRVGVPKEIKPDEYRVGLTPTSVREYVAHGHQVVVEAGAGVGAGFVDEDFTRAGASILPDADAIFSAADMIVKVKEPQPGEWKRLKSNQILFTYLHLAPDPDQTRGLQESGCAAVAYETVTDARGACRCWPP
jgi:alanine dehydrogenase